MKIGPLTLTRDSALWTYGMIAAIVMALATLGNGVTDYGIPLAAVPYIRLLALVIGVVSGKLASSWLPGKNDPPKGSVDLSKIGPALLLVAALGGAVMLPACAAKTAPVLSPTQSQKALTAVRRVGVVVEQVQREELALFAAGVVPPADHAVIVKAFAETSTAVLASIDTLEKTAGADPRQAVQAVSDGLKTLAQTFAHLNSKQTAQLSGWLDTAAALVDLALQ